MALAYSPADAAREIGISRARLYDHLASGAIKAKKDGQRTLIPHDELVRFLAALPDQEYAA